MAFGIALLKSGYMFPLIKGTELVAGGPAAGFELALAWSCRAAYRPPLAPRDFGATRA